jgi:hypothetical protein
MNYQKENIEKIFFIKIIKKILKFNKKDIYFFQNKDNLKKLIK